MCPFCLVTMGLIAASVASTGGLAALAVKGLAKRTQQEQSSHTQITRIRIKREIKMSTSMTEHPNIVSRDE
jgi:hypothetical protein